MSIKYFVALSLGLAFAHIASAQEETWKDEQGRPVPPTEARRSMNGLGGSLLVTPDADWREKWNTPPESVPHFKETNAVSRGEQVFVLILFSNPALDKDGRANLTCDLHITRPDGTESMNERDVVCFQDHVKSESYNVYLAAPVIGFIGEAADPAGTWTVRVSLKDNLRNIVMPLKTSFVLK